MLLPIISTIAKNKKTGPFDISLISWWDHWFLVLELESGSGRFKLGHISSHDWARRVVFEAWDLTQTQLQLQHIVMAGLRPGHTPFIFPNISFMLMAIPERRPALDFESICGHRGWFIEHAWVRFYSLVLITRPWWWIASPAPALNFCRTVAHCRDFDVLVRQIYYSGSGDTLFGRPLKVFVLSDTYPIINSSHHFFACWPSTQKHSYPRWSTTLPGEFQELRMAPGVLRSCDRCKVPPVRTRTCINIVIYSWYTI